MAVRPRRWKKRGSIFLDKEDRPWKENSNERATPSSLRESNLAQVEGGAWYPGVLEQSANRVFFKTLLESE
jgi:hypothetical protein